MVILALGACGTACGGGRGSIEALTRLPTGADYVWVPTQSGIFPINIVSHTKGRPLRLKVLDDFHQELAFAPRGFSAYIASAVVSINLTTGAVGRPISQA